MEGIVRCRGKLAAALVVSVLVVAAVLFVTGCSSSSTSSSTTSPSVEASTTIASTGETATTAVPTTVPEAQATGLGAGLTVRVLGGPLADPFFGAVEKGGEDAAAQLGADYEYLSPKDFSNAAQDLTQLIQTAVNKKSDVFVVGDFIGPIEDPEIVKAVDAGITVVVYNSGRDTWQDLGAVGFVGENAAGTGTAAGQLFCDAGVTNLLCINHVPENPVLQVRCDNAIAAVKAKGGAGDTLTIPSSEGLDAQGVTQKIKGYLLSHPDVNGIFTLGAGIAVDAENAVSEAGKTITIGTTDLSLQVLDDVKSGKLLFTIDQQGYLQTYLATIIGVQSRVVGLQPLNAIDTSPLVITTDNVDKVIEAQQNYGIRGAN